MNIALVACKTLEDEVNKAIKSTKTNYELHWIESGLHNYPDRLRKALQDTIDSIENKEYIVILFGLCGNSLLGLKSEKSTLVIPKVDDCISLFLGGNVKRRQMELNAKAYYLTRGWLRYENNIWQEYQRSIDRYGLEKTRSIFSIMLKHYTHLAVIDTGAYETEIFYNETKEIARELGLELKLVPGELDLLFDALCTNWHSGFALVQPGQQVTLRDLDNCCNYLGDEKDHLSQTI